MGDGMSNSRPGPPPIAILEPIRHHAREAQPVSAIDDLLPRTYAARNRSRPWTESRA